MSVELDHFFVCTAVGAPEAERLIEFGLVEGTPNRHPGQGTANRRFFFGNAFLELLWIVDPVEAQSSLVRRTGLWERWSCRGQGASPFGVGFRPVPGTGREAPFRAWEYRPPFLPEPLAIQMACKSEMSAEPLLFYLPFARRPDPDDLSRRQPREHPIGFRKVTRLRVGIHRDQAMSPELLAAANHCDEVRFCADDETVMEIGFDDEKEGRSVDFRPALQLLFRW